MTRHLILLSLDWIRPKDPRTSLGHASLIARLALVPDLTVTPIAFAVNEPGFNRERVLETLIAAIGDGRSDVAIGAYVWNEPVIQWLLPALRRTGFRGRIILGGPQISYAPPGIDATYPDADIFIRGYGEDALAAVAATDALQVPGVSRRGSDMSERPAAVDLEGLPSPFLSGALAPSRFVRWETQRGCIYSCSFCQHRESGSRLRQNTLAPTRTAAEIDQFIRDGVQDIAVLDPIFHTNPAAAAILRRFGKAGFSGRISLQSRFELIDDDFLDACAELDVRLEFGIQTVQRAEMRAVGRMNDLVKADAVIGALHRRGIPFEVSLIYGLPANTCVLRGERPVVPGPGRADAEGVPPHAAARHRTGPGPRAVGARRERRRHSRGR
ncbi:MAG: radical SAM protein, partial [Deltaproteobacteria bacterium]|nr:radical SAM protein [Deltaproteobacteria bacterium]